MTRTLSGVLGLMSVLLALGLGLSLMMGGCDAPNIVPIPPPGGGFPRIPPAEPEGKGPQALGEPSMRTPMDPSRKKAVAGTVSPPTALGETKTTPSGVKYETLKEGDGPELKPGQTVSVHYTGTLADGKVFDTSHQDKDEPRTFEIGTDKVIAGWEEGVPGMKVGERRKLTIPPELGYGEQGNPPSIPANATIVFEIELVKIVK